MITPSGKRRMQFAQQTATAMPPATESIDFGDSSVPEQNATEGQIPSDITQQLPENQQVDQLQNEVDQVQEQQESPQGDSTVIKVIFDFLVSMGFEPRRLQEFKASFVTEEGSADGDSSMKVKIPDAMGNTGEPIPKPKLRALVKKIEQTSKMHFTNYKRSNKEIELNFTSANPNAQDQIVERDILDEVYGSPKNNKSNTPGSPKHNANAKTLREMIKENKSNVVEMLLQKIGDHSND